MSLRAWAAIAGLVIASIAIAWSLALWRGGRPGEDLPEPAALEGPLDPAAVEEALRHLDDASPHRALLRHAGLAEARWDRGGWIDVSLDPRSVARSAAAARGAGSYVGLLPTSARGRIRLAPSPQDAKAPAVSDAWRLACPDGCLLDLLAREPARGCPSGGWAVVPSDATATAWFALDASRLGDPSLGGEGLAPVRRRIASLETILGRPIREELAADLAGTGVLALSEPQSRSGPRTVAALDLARADRVRDLLDTLVSIAVLADRATIRRHRDVALAVLGRPGREVALVAAVDGSLLLLADDVAGMEAALDRRRAGSGADPAARRELSRREGSFRAESRSPYVARSWWELLDGAKGPDRGAPGALPGAAWLSRDGAGWWLRGEGSSPAIAADPVVPAIRSWLRRLQRADG